MTRALIIGAAALVVGCGGNPSKKPIVILDAPTIDTWGCSGDAICNPAAQYGCCAGYKCTWITDATAPMPLGHIDCAPDGAAQPGDACTVGPPGSTTGFDNCVHGYFCVAGRCEPICDPSQGIAACSQGFACAYVANAFVVNMTNTYGTCQATCDPLADNTFGKGTKSGTTCAANQGCYGYPDFGSQPPSYYTCAAELEPGNVQGTECNNTGAGCAASDGTPMMNGCAQGFMPFYFESETVLTRVCTSFCAPASCYAGNCGADGMNYVGLAPHRCNDTDSSGTFDMTSGGHNCHFMWDYEWDEMTMPISSTFIRSPTSDTLGFCDNHALFKYASQPGSGMGDTQIPGCDQITLRGFGDHAVHAPSSGTTCPNNAATCCQTTNGCLGAADFGCVDSSSAGLPFSGKGFAPAVGIVQRPRPPFRLQ